MRYKLNEYPYKIILQVSTTSIYLTKIFPTSLYLLKIFKKNRTFAFIKTLHACFMLEF